MTAREFGTIISDLGIAVLYLAAAGVLVRLVVLVARKAGR